MPTITCPYCASRSNVTYLTETLVQADPSRVSRVGRCDNCGNVVVATRDTELIHPNYQGDSNSIRRAFNEAGDAGTTWEPKTVLGRDFPDIPDHIAPAASEAFECFSIGAYRATVLLARAVLEASAKDVGVTTGNLYQKIDKLAEKGFVRSILADAAHEIRLAGNDMAHGDFATASISEEEADELLGFMEDFLREMFEVPTRIKRRKDRRSSEA